MLSWSCRSINYCCIQLVLLYYFTYIYGARSNTNQGTFNIYKYKLLKCRTNNKEITITFPIFRFFLMVLSCWNLLRFIVTDVCLTLQFLPILFSFLSPLRIHLLTLTFLSLHSFPVIFSCGLFKRRCYKSIGILHGNWLFSIIIVHHHHSIIMACHHHHHHHHGHHYNRHQIQDPGSLTYSFPLLTWTNLPIFLVLCFVYLFSVRIPFIVKIVVLLFLTVILNVLVATCIL